MARAGHVPFPWFKAVLRLLLAVGLLFLVLRVATFGFQHFLWRSFDDILLRDQAQILYHIDHAALAREARSFAEQQRIQGKIPYTLRQGDPEMPAAFAILKPRSVYVTEDLIQLDFGGAALSYGIVIYNEGLEGPGTKKLGEGVWFYSENGSYPSPKGDKIWGPPAY